MPERPEMEPIAQGTNAERKAMLDRFVAAWNRHDLDGLMACFTEDCVFWSSAGPHPEGGVFEGYDAVAAASRALFDAFPDAAWTENQATVFGDRALWEWIFVGTGRNGEPVRVRGVDVLELAGDRIRRKNSFRKSVIAPD